MKKIIIALIFIAVMAAGCSSVSIETTSGNTTEIPKEQPALEPEVKEKEEVVIVEPKDEEKSTNIDDEKEEIAQEENTEKPEEKGDNLLEDMELPDIDLDEIDTSSLSNETKGWSWKRNTEHEPPIAYADMEILQEYNAYYLVPTDEKVIYLTYDNGYENGYTGAILDALAANDVKGIFFVTQSYIRDNKELVIRMKEEGHLVGNHSVRHKSMPSLSDEEVIKEIEDVAKYMKEVTGYEMDPYFRPPMGEYSERTLYLTNYIGYKSIFWSIAYVDWLVDDQPGPEYALDHVMTNYHPGAMPLLHSVSSSNAEAMDSIIKSLKAEGYRFGTLDELN